MRQPEGDLDTFKALIRRRALIASSVDSRNVVI
jgi:hypothetical protein